MYTKNDAYQALNMLKYRYKNIQERIERFKKDVAECEQSKQNWEYVKGVKKSKGVFWTGFFAANMLWGLASWVLLIPFVGAAVGMFVYTQKNEAKINKIIDDHNKYIENRRQILDNLEQSLKLVTKELDSLQDVVHSQKPIERKHEMIMKGMNMRPSKEEVMER